MLLEDNLKRLPCGRAGTKRIQQDKQDKIKRKILFIPFILFILFCFLAEKAKISFLMS